jgi:hypothetical protein
MTVLTLEELYYTPYSTPKRASFSHGGIVYIGGAMRKPFLPEDIRAYFVKMGARGGRLGAKRRMEKVSPERRREIAQHAIAARWEKQRADKRKRRG